MNEEPTTTNTPPDDDFVEAKFTDSQGRDWPLRIDFPDIFRIKKMTTVDLVAANGMAPVEDPAVFVAVMYSAWKARCDELSIDDEGFGRLVTDCFDAAGLAFIEALADFFHRIGRKAQARSLRLGLKAAPGEMAKAEKTLDQTTLARLMTKSMEVMSLTLKKELEEAEAKLDAALGNAPTSSPELPASAI